MPLTGSRVSRHARVKIRRALGCFPDDDTSCHFEKKKYLHDMDLKLTKHVRSTIFLLYDQTNLVKFRYLELFSEKSIFARISVKINIFRSAMFYYVIVTSNVDWFSWFWCQWKEETLFYTMVPNKACLFQIHREVVTTTAPRYVTHTHTHTHTPHTHPHPPPHIHTHTHTPTPPPPPPHTHTHTHIRLGKTRVKHIKASQKNDLMYYSL